jgi:hypothetical protein
MKQLIILCATLTARGTKNINLQNCEKIGLEYRCTTNNERICGCDCISKLLSTQASLYYGRQKRPPNAYFVSVFFVDLRGSKLNHQLKIITSSIIVSSGVALITMFKSHSHRHRLLDVCQIIFGCRKSSFDSTSTAELAVGCM